MPRFVGLLICLGLTGVAAVNDRAGFMHDISPASAWVVVAVLCMVFALFGAIALRAVGQLRSRVWFLLGTLTYPLYLIHNEVGKAVFYAVGAQVSAWSRLVVTLTVIGVISWLMAVIVERRASPALRRLLTRAQARAT